MPATGYIPFKPAPVPAPRQTDGKVGQIQPRQTDGKIGQIQPQPIAYNGIVTTPNKPTPSPVIGPNRPAPPLLVASRSTQPALIAGNPKPVVNLLTSKSSLLGNLTKRL